MINVLIASPCVGMYGGIEAFVFAVARHLHKHPDFTPRVCFKKVRGFRLEPNLSEQAEASGVETVYVERASRELWDHIGWADVVHGQNAPLDIAAFTRMRGRKLALTIHHWRRTGLSPHVLSWGLAASLAHARWYNSRFVMGTWEGETPRPGSLHIPTVSDLPTGEVPCDERKGFVFLARWIGNKGVEVLVEAYRRAGLNGDEWPLVLMGDGPLKPKILEKIEREGIRGIVVKGFVAEEEKVETIRRAKWMVVPAHTREDFGLTAVEARSVGVPCIVTRDGGLPEAGGPEALKCTPGSVEDLTEKLRAAAAFSEQDYAEKARRSREGLAELLVPLDFYPKAFEALMSGKPVEKFHASVG